jgi:hypothetical protein
MNAGKICEVRKLLSDLIDLVESQFLLPAPDPTDDEPPFSWTHFRYCESNILARCFDAYRPDNSGDCRREILNQLFVDEPDLWSVILAPGCEKARVPRQDEFDDEVVLAWDTQIMEIARDIGLRNIEALAQQVIA